MSNLERDMLDAEIKRRGDRIVELNRQRSALEAENTKLRNANTELQRQIANATPPGSYLVRSPGVYVVTPSQHSAVGLDVYRHELKDAVVLTDPPGPSDAARWVQFYRDGITGDATAWYPPDGLQDALRWTWLADQSAKPWVGIDPAKPGDDMTTVGLREQIMQPGLMAKVGIDPGNGDDLTTVGMRVERRVDRLEAWARQFDGVRVHKSVQAGGPLVEMRGPMVEMRALDIKPLDHLEPK